MMRTKPNDEEKEKIKEAIRKKGTVNYDTEIGLTYPSLTEKEARSFMPPYARSILDSYNSMTFNVYREEDKKKILEYIREHPPVVKRAEYNMGWEIGNTIYTAATSPQEAIEKFISSNVAPKSLEQYLAEGYKVSYIDPPDELKPDNPFSIFFSFPQYTVQKPTLAGGLARFLGPYHLYDPATGLDLFLPDWGVDYDVGRKKCFPVTLLFIMPPWSGTTRSTTSHGSGMMETSTW